MKKGDPMEVLFYEHGKIKEALQFVLRSPALLEASPVRYEELIRLLLKFFREYADKFHHKKEEEVLFPAIQAKNQTVGTVITNEMVDQHEEFRGMLRKGEGLLDQKKYTEANVCFQTYREALLDHIAAEDEEVFQIGTTLLTGEEADRMHYQFEDMDRSPGGSSKGELELLLLKAEGLFNR